MANYTMTINECLINPLTPMFNFDYPFYIDDVEAKAKFEEKFILYYWNCEIGFETFARFQKALQSRLTIKMPYYRQLYETELKSKDINFLLNKDLTETFSREIDTENQLSGTNTTNQNSSGTNSFNQTGSTNSTNSMTQSATSNSTNSMTQSATSSSTNSTEQNGTTTNTHKESAINDGVAMATLSEGYLTGTSSDSGTSTNDLTSSTTTENETTVSSSSTGENKSTESSSSSSENNSTESSSSTSENESTESSSSKGENESTESSSSTGENETSGTSNSTDNVETKGTSSQTGNEKMVEKTVLLSQGNIGITSSAELLQKWREVLINIDEIIIEDCRDLFMRIY